jgi:hypothetical protein
MPEGESSGSLFGAFQERWSVMRRIMGVVLMALALIASVSVFSSASAGDSGSSHHSATLRLLARTVDSSETGTGAPSIGDSFAFTDDVFMKGKLVGTDHGTCTATRVKGPDVTLQCLVTLVLNGKGQITVQGAATFQETGTPQFTLAITGGTHQFRDVDGQVKVREINNTDDSVLLVEFDD